MRFVHRLLGYSSLDELKDEVVPYLMAGLEEGDTVFVNLALPSIIALESAIGPDAARVRWTDTYEWVPHPGRRLRAIEDLIAAHEKDGGGRLRFVGECAFPPAPVEVLQEWNRFDAALNYALAGANVDMLCVYDENVLPAGVLADVQLCHPHLGTDIDPSTNSRYLPPEMLLRHLGSSDLCLPADATTVHVTSPRAARRFVRRELGSGRLTSDQLDDMAIVATELVTNAWRAEAATVQVSCWNTPSGAAVQVDDDGPGLVDPLAGYRRPRAGSATGRGLWMSRQLADVMETKGGPDGTSIRVEVLAIGV